MPSYSYRGVYVNSQKKIGYVLEVLLLEIISRLYAIVNALAVEATLSHVQQWHSTTERA
jgi:hypothetical protein